MVLGRDRREHYVSDFNSGGQHSRQHEDSEENIDERMRQITTERAQEYGTQSRRPTTPDFSLEKKTKKERDEDVRIKEEKKMRNMQVMMNSTHVNTEARRFKLAHTFHNIIDIVESDDECCKHV